MPRAVLNSLHCKLKDPSSNISTIKWLWCQHSDCEKFIIAQWDVSNTDGKWLLTCFQNVGNYLPTSIAP